MKIFPYFKMRIKVDSRFRANTISIKRTQFVVCLTSNYTHTIACIRFPLHTQVIVLTDFVCWILYTFKRATTHAYTLTQKCRIANRFDDVVVCLHWCVNYSRSKLLCRLFNLDAQIRFAPLIRVSFSDLCILWVSSSQ